ncbi:MAG: hypothetical protein HRU19_07355 [Pseudobacteriovorax sp.]|nr:hypothetical protein [Pseudobacteriovorax sp.]
MRPLIPWKAIVIMTGFGKRHVLAKMVFTAGVATTGVSAQEFQNSTFEIPYWDRSSTPVAHLIGKPIDTKSLFNFPKIRGIEVDSPDCAAVAGCAVGSESSPLLTETPTGDQKMLIDGVGSEVDVTHLTGTNSQVFIRDAGIVKFNKELGRLVGVSAGSTELYVINGIDMQIVPVSVVGSQDLAFSGDLAKVDLTTTSSGENSVDFARLSEPYEAGANIPSLRLPVFSDDYQINDQLLSFQREYGQAKFKKIAIRAVDYLSSKGQEKPGGVPGVTVRLIGSDFVGRTNVQGIVEVADVPIGSRFNVKFEDKAGRIMEQMTELATESTRAGEIFTVRIMPYETFSLYTQMTDVTQKAYLSSMCVRLMTYDGNSPLDGFSLQITNEPVNSEARGPFYLNNYVPDLSLSATGQTGRACFFNLEPGLVELDILEEDQLVGTTTISLGEGLHLEEDIALSDSGAIKAQVVAMPGVVDMIHRNVVGYYPLDYVDMTKVSSDDDFEVLAPGLIKFPRGTTSNRGRAFGIVRVSDFEDALYVFDEVTRSSQAQGVEVVKLLQAGFVEELYRLLYEDTEQARFAYDSSSGKVFVRHGIEEQVDPDSVSFKLLNQYGNEVSDGWIFGSGEDGFVNAMFFNVEPGLYSLVVQTERNHWLDATTLPVGESLTTVIQTGKPLVPMSQTKKN